MRNPAIVLVEVSKIKESHDIVVNEVLRNLQAGIALITADAKRCHRETMALFRLFEAEGLVRIEGGRAFLEGTPIVLTITDNG